MDLAGTSTTKHKQAEFAEPCIFKSNSSDNAYETTSPQGTEHRVCSEDEFAEQRLSSQRGSDPISRPQAGKSNMHNQAHDNSCYCQEAAAPEGSSLVSQGNGDGIAESVPHAMRGISRSGMPIRNDKACNQNACDEETEDASRSAFQRDYEGGESLPQASQARRDSPDRYTFDSGPESLSGGSGGSTNGLLHVDSFALGLAQHDPLDLMMGALADMHEVSTDTLRAVHGSAAVGDA